MVKNLENIFEEYKTKWINLEFISEIKSWKEAEVIKVKSWDNFLALKIYKNPEERTFKNNADYLAGKFYKSINERKAVKAKNSFSKKLIHSNWVRREFYMLEKIYSLWGSIPRPIDYTLDTILMELVWDENSVWQKLKDVIFEIEEAKKVFNLIIDNVRIFYKVWIVHSDLSAFNILYYNSKIYIIDFPQSIDVRTNPNVKNFLERDIRNVCEYFKKHFEIDTDEKLNKLFYELIN